jgi:hypothetical protein
MFNPDQNRLAPTLAMIMAASLVGFITGYTVPLISLELAQQQIAPLYVGLLAALPPAGMMISSFLSPALCRRVEMGVLLSVAKGTSTVTESVWDNRFRYVDELRKMGAVVQVDGQVAVFEGVDKLNPAPLRASDLRAGAAMVVAALMADGTSEIEEIGHIERGYENIVEKLRGLGAEISKVDRMPAALESAM